MADSTEARKRTKHDRNHSPQSIPMPFPILGAPASREDRLCSPMPTALTNESLHHQQPQPSNSGAKTLRLTENKRRYRARRKAYISDLERNLAEARTQGVQATKEVQRAARQVILNNGRLRELLRLAGFSNADIDSWLGAGCGGPGSDASESSCHRQSQVEQKARRCATALAAYQETAARMAPSTDTTIEKGPVNAIDASGMASTLQSLDTDDALTSDGSKPNTCDRSRGFEVAATYKSDPSLITRTSRTPEAETSSSIGHNAKRIIPSCKLLTRLTENPAADITQVPFAVPSTSDDDTNQDAAVSHGGAGIECRKAYDMLIQFATTEEKMDTIARALESGCTKNGNGGCAVKAEVVWQALDGMCGVRAGIEGSNRTGWPLDGGSLRLNSSHEGDYHFYNLGLGGNASNFNISLTHGLVNVTGKGVLCVPKLGLPADIGVKHGDLASLQCAETLGSDECASDPGVTSPVIGDSEHADGHDDTTGNASGAGSNASTTTATSTAAGTIGDARCLLSSVFVATLTLAFVW